MAAAYFAIKRYKSDVNGRRLREEARLAENDKLTQTKIILLNTPPNFLMSSKKYFKFKVS